MKLMFRGELRDERNSGFDAGSGAEPGDF